MNRTISTVLFGLLLLSLLAMLPIGWVTYYPSFILPELSGLHQTKSATEYYEDIATAIVNRVHESMLTYGGQTDERRLYAWNSTEEFPSLDFNPELAETLAHTLKAVQQDLMNSVYSYSGTNNIFQIQLTDGKTYIVYYQAGKNPTQVGVQFAIVQNDYFYQTLLPSACDLICAQSVERSSLYVYLHPPDDEQDKVILSDTVFSNEELIELAANRAELGDLGHLWIFGPKELRHTETIAMTWLLALLIVAICLTTVLFIRGLRSTAILH